MTEDGRRKTEVRKQIADKDVISNTLEEQRIADPCEFYARSWQRK
jgi:hypothetical protein